MKAIIWKDETLGAEFVEQDIPDDLADLVAEYREKLVETAVEHDDAALPLRKWANQAFGMAANLIWNRKGRISDTINGFRGVRREVFERLAPASVGFTIEYELTIRALKAGVKIVEIPTIEGDRIGGETKAHSIRTGLRFLGFLGKEIVAGKRL